MQKNTTYILAVCCCLWLIGCNWKPRLPDLRESYSAYDTKPFGAYVAKSILENSFPENYVQTVKESFDKSVFNLDDTSSVYFSVSRNLFVEENEVDAILNFVYNGNTVFFAAANFDSNLLNKIFCRVTAADRFRANTPGSYRETSVSLLEKLGPSKDSFSYFYKPFASYFSEMNDRYCRIIGYNDSGNSNCIVFFWGKGKLFLHTDPRVFSNYFLLKNNNYRYMLGLTQIMYDHPQHVYWSDYYSKLNKRRGEGSTGSSLREIFKYPPLQASFWILLAMLIMYILFGSKRKQRIMKEIRPNLNSSVAFTETIARLYLQKHDNKNIADKMINYFYEFIRNNYFLNTSAGNIDFIKALSRKSGISEEKTTALFNAINHANQNSVIDDYQLLSLNDQIQQFYKKRK